VKIACVDRALQRIEDNAFGCARLAASKLKTSASLLSPTLKCGIDCQRRFELKPSTSTPTRTLVNSKGNTMNTTVKCCGGRCRPTREDHKRKGRNQSRKRCRTISTSSRYWDTAISAMPWYQSTMNAYESIPPVRLRDHPGQRNRQVRWHGSLANTLNSSERAHPSLGDGYHRSNLCSSGRAADPKITRVSVWAPATKVDRELDSAPK